MIQIICKSESYTYNAYHILKAFYPSQEVSCKTDEKASNYVMVHLPDDREISVGFENTVEITDTAGRDESTGKIQEDSEKESQKKERKRQIDLSLYDQLERITGEPLAWGVLTGVRPTKLAMQKLEAGWKKEDYINWAWKSARVRGEKAALAWEIAEREQKILKELDYENGYSLYVGIPFCPSVCSYCSFSSTGSLERKSGCICGCTLQRAGIYRRTLEKQKIKYDLHRRRYADNADGRAAGTADELDR